MAIVAAVLALVAIVVGVVAVNSKPKGPDLQALYDEYCDSPWAKVASYGSYLSIDTNPSDTESGKYTYILDANQAIEDVNKALGFKESLLEEMNHTNSLMGVRTETDNGIKVTWRYHPDNGLEVTYSSVSARDETASHFFASKEWEAFCVVVASVAAALGLTPRTASGGSKQGRRRTDTSSATHGCARER